MFRFRCPNYHRLTADADPSNTTVACPKCRVGFVVKENFVSSSTALVDRLPEQMRQSSRQQPLTDTAVMRILDTAEAC